MRGQLLELKVEQEAIVNLLLLLLLVEVAVGMAIQVLVVLAITAPLEAATLTEQTSLLALLVLETLLLEAHHKEIMEV